MPDVIIEPSMDAGRIQEQKETAAVFYQRFAMTPAVRNNRIYIIDGDLVSRLGPRLDEGMQLVADCIWPEGTQ
jgi:ABC-type hemin transport system substrate-binding protein